MVGTQKNKKLQLFFFGMGGLREAPKSRCRKGFSLLTLPFVGTTGDIGGIVCRAFKASFSPRRSQENGAGLMEIGPSNG